MIHHVPQKVLFKHCDPAGIVFYPRYVEMINDAVEDWFTGPLQTPWHIFHHTNGCPTVEINVKFIAVTHHGDELDLQVQVTKLGNTSVSLAVDAYCGDELRFAARLTMVCVDLDKKPQPWEAELRARIKRFLN